MLKIFIEKEKSKIIFIPFKNINYNYINSIVEKNFSFNYEDFIKENTFNSDILLSNIFKKLFDNKNIEGIHNKHKFYLQIYFKSDFYETLYKNQTTDIILPNFNEIEIHFEHKKTYKYFFHLLFPEYNKKYKLLKLVSNKAPIFISPKTFNKQLIKSLFINLFVEPNTNKNEINLSQILFNEKSNIILKNFKNIYGSINKFNSLKISHGTIDKNIFNKISYINILKLKNIKNLNNIILTLFNKNINYLNIDGTYTSNLDNLNIIKELNILNEIKIKNVNVECLDLINTKTIKIQNSKIQNLLLENVGSADLDKIETNYLKISNINEININNSVIKNGNIKLGNNVNLNNLNIKNFLKLFNNNKLYINNNIGNTLELENNNTILFEYNTTEKFIKTFFEKNNKLLEKMVINKQEKTCEIKFKFFFTNNFLNKDIEKKCIIDIFKRIKITQNTNINVDFNSDNFINFLNKKQLQIYFSLIENFYYFLTNNYKYKNNIFIENLRLNLQKNFDNQMIIKLTKLINHFNKISGLQKDNIKETFYKILKENIELLLKNEKFVPEFYKQEFRKIQNKTNSKLLSI